MTTGDWMLVGGAGAAGQTGVKVAHGAVTGAVKPTAAGVALPLGLGRIAIGSLGAGAPRVAVHGGGHAQERARRQ